MAMMQSLEAVVYGAIANSKRHQQTRVGSYNKSTLTPIKVQLTAKKNMEIHCIEAIRHLLSHWPRRTWLCGNSLICFSLKMNGTGMNRNRAIRNMQPVTTPIASGLKSKEWINFFIEWLIDCTESAEIQCKHTFLAYRACTSHCRINWLQWTYH